MGLIVLALAILAMGWIGWRVWIAAHAPPPVLSLDVNRERDVRLLPGIPLVFTVTVSGAPGGPVTRIGGAGDPWWDHVRMVTEGGRRGIPWKPSPLSSPVSIRFGRDAHGHPTVEQGSDEEALLDADHVHTIDLAVGPEETARVAAGRYTIVASLHQPLWPPWRWRPTVISNAVVVTIRRAAGATIPAAELESLRLAELADYYLRAKKYEDARKTALRMLEADPRSADGYMNLGDALGGLGKNADALEAYEDALLVGPPPGPEAEPPSYLIERIGEVADRMKKH
jgi:hypothetical protein